MAAVNFDLKFTYVLAGWEGSAHDAHVLADAIERDDGFIVPEGITCCNSFYIVVHSIETYLHYRLCFGPFVGKFYPVDAGYACPVVSFLPTGGLGTIYLNMGAGTTQTMQGSCST
jgi:hypothetical protein